MNSREITITVVDAVLSGWDAAPGELVELEWSHGELWAVCTDAGNHHGCIAPWPTKPRGMKYRTGEKVPVWLNGEPFENFPATDSKAEGDRDDDLTWRVREGA